MKVIETMFLRKFFILSLLAVIIRADNYYCDPSICSHGKRHVACGKDIMWHVRCKNAEFVQFTPELKELLLYTHNKLRNQQANGETPGFAPAKRMATMTWDDELADIAMYNTMNCKMEHDKCRSTELFQMAGQNLAEASGNNGDEWIIETRPIHWFAENENADMSDINIFKSVLAPNGEMIGHFTQVVKDDAYKVGCSIAKYNHGHERKSLLACNYAVTNVNGRPIYEAGETATGCKSGTNPEFTGLCSVDELYEKPYFRRE